LAVASLVVLMAHRTFAVASDLARRTAEHRAAVDRTMNARRFLTQAFGGLDLGGSPPAGFSGSTTDVVFAAWLWGADGQMKQRPIVISVLGPPDSIGRLVAIVRDPRTSNADTLLLVPRAAALALDYLGGYGAAAPWLGEWQSAMDAPVAVRLRIVHADTSEGVDTLLFAVGPRG
jgi:hypothetical protein